MMRKLMAVIALTILTVAPVKAADIEGTYDCVGEAGGGGMYKGTVKIAKSGDTYEITWTIAGQTHIGVGFIENDRLCSSWATSAGGKLIKGVVVYKIEKDKLTGRWCQYPGNGKIFTETLTK